MSAAILERQHFTVINATVGKAGAALAQAAINALLLAGQIGRVNGRLVLAGGSS
jgi:hypothetical protein